MAILTKKQVQAKLNKALTHLLRAQNELSLLLDEANQVGSARDWNLIGTINYFYAQVTDIVSTDKGEAGLLPYVSQLTKEIKASKGGSRKPTQEQIANALKRAYR